MSATLRFDQVTCRRGGRIVFTDVSFTAAAGDAIIVTGPNGAGKSSLLRLAAGLLRPAAGQVAAPAAALLAEAPALDAEQPLGAALTFWARLDRQPEPVARVTAALDDVDLTSLAAVPVRLLSTGQRRRAALARVLAARAPLWLLDEPANGLDARSVVTLARLIARHRAAGGIALVTTHLPLDVPHAQPLVLG